MSPEKKCLIVCVFGKKSLPFDAGRNKMFVQGGKNLAPSPEYLMVRP